MVDYEKMFFFDRKLNDCVIFSEFSKKKLIFTIIQLAFLKGRIALKGNELANWHR